MHASIQARWLQDCQFQSTPIFDHYHPVTVSRKKEFVNKDGNIMIFYSVSDLKKVLEIAACSMPKCSQWIKQNLPIKHFFGKSQKML